MSDKPFVAVIGGSGVYNLDVVNIVKSHDIKTPFGKPSSEILEMELEGSRFYFLARHGKGHAISPSEINYRANIYALKKLGVKNIVSVSAVGSLREELPSGMMVLPDQFIDWTKGFRARSFFENGIVGHVSTALPIESSLQDSIENACKNSDVNVSRGGTYICIEGPQFSSKAESAFYRSDAINASIIGMTNVPESYLAKEAGIAYATLAMVTDYDCWKEEHCTLEEILKVMSENYIKAQKVLTKLIPDLYANPISFQSENQYAVVTNPELWSETQKEIVEVLIKS